MTKQFKTSSSKMEICGNNETEEIWNKNLQKQQTHKLQTKKSYNQMQIRKNINN